MNTSSTNSNNNLNLNLNLNNGSSSSQSTVVAHILVVNFHPTLGNSIEFSYPRLRGSVVLRSPKLADSTDICADPISPHIYNHTFIPPTPSVSTTTTWDKSVTERLGVSQHEGMSAKGDWGLLPQEWAFLPFMALPDGCHDLQTDTVFFTLPTNVHCVAAFRQLRLKQNLAGPTIDASSATVGVNSISSARTNHPMDAPPSRGSIQKSVVVLCKRPVHGLVTPLLQQQVNAWFASRDFQQKDILIELYHSLNQTIATHLPVTPSPTNRSRSSTISTSTTFTTTKTSKAKGVMTTDNSTSPSDNIKPSTTAPSTSQPYPSQTPSASSPSSPSLPSSSTPSSILYQNLDLKYLLQTLGPQLLSLLKIILLEKRTILYSTPVYRASNAVLTLVSIFPGGFDSLSPNMTPLGVSELDEMYGFPLGVFADRYRFVVQGHAPLPLLGKLLERARGALVGTSQNVGRLLTSTAVAAARRSTGRDNEKRSSAKPPAFTQAGGKDESLGDEKVAEGDGRGRNVKKGVASKRPMSLPIPTNTSTSVSSSPNKLPAVDALANVKSGKVAVTGALEPLCRITRSERFFIKDIISIVSSTDFTRRYSIQQQNDYVRERLQEYLHGLLGTVASIPGVRGGPRGETWSAEMVDRFDVSIANEYGEAFVRSWLQTRTAARAARRWDKRIARRRTLWEEGENGSRGFDKEEDVNSNSGGVGSMGILAGLREMAEAGAMGIGSFFRSVESEMARIETAISSVNGDGGGSSRGNASESRKGKVSEER